MSWPAAGQSTPCGRLGPVCRGSTSATSASLGTMADMTTETRTETGPEHPATNYLPEGYSTITPMLVISPASQAISFYTEVFGATVASRLDGPDGAVLHAELQLA